VVFVDGLSSIRAVDSNPGVRSDIVITALKVRMTSNRRLIVKKRRTGAHQDPPLRSALEYVRTLDAHDLKGYANLFAGTGNGWEV
jgi:hypothetical protein